MTGRQSAEPLWRAPGLPVPPSCRVPRMLMNVFSQLTEANARLAAIQTTGPEAYPEVARAVSALSNPMAHEMIRLWVMRREGNKWGASVSAIWIERLKQRHAASG
jgi:hypothetical protein